MAKGQGEDEGAALGSEKTWGLSSLEIGLN